MQPDLYVFKYIKSITAISTYHTCATCYIYMILMFFSSFVPENAAFCPSSPIIKSEPVDNNSVDYQSLPDEDEESSSPYSNSSSPQEDGTRQLVTYIGEDHISETPTSPLSTVATLLPHEGVSQSHVADTNTDKANMSEPPKPSINSQLVLPLGTSTEKRNANSNNHCNTIIRTIGTLYPLERQPLRSIPTFSSEPPPLLRAFPSKPKMDRDAVASVVQPHVIPVGIHDPSTLMVCMLPPCCVPYSLGRDKLLKSKWRSCCTISSSDWRKMWKTNK